MNTNGLLRSTNKLGTVYLLPDGFKWYPSKLYFSGCVPLKRHGGV